MEQIPVPKQQNQDEERIEEVQPESKPTSIWDELTEQEKADLDTRDEDAYMKGQY